jgi:hypothetical protein
MAGCGTVALPFAVLGAGLRWRSLPGRFTVPLHLLVDQFLFGWLNVIGAA